MEQPPKPHSTVRPSPGVGGATLPLVLELPLLAAVGLLDAVAACEDPADMCRRVFGDGPAPAGRFVAAAAACLPVSGDSPNIYLGEACRLVLDHLWVEAAATIGPVAAGQQLHEALDAVVRAISTASRAPRPDVQRAIGALVAHVVAVSDHPASRFAISESRAGAGGTSPSGR